jgi:hypothetical protein
LVGFDIIGGMKIRNATFLIKARSVLVSIIWAESLLLVPLVAMRFSHEWNWGVFDFILVGILLAGVGVSMQMIRTGWKASRLLTAIGAVLLAMILLLWAELAVGVFGTPFAGS